ncbi:FadR family transcriptional regulator [Fictibacillus nanhaiensis]|uniref:FadR family transcriptional regulator n=1 Tax=Fictibacillus nanhaiensis TaxID=742169 RepID=A0ABS2ZRP6_9BACL|nr:FadR family transcriptional regulator [Fictibacillus nanhaiensis]
MKTRSSDSVRRQIIHSIIEGKIGFHKLMPSERDFASQFNVGRPTIREALQRLEQNGWITTHKGMPATVNDYWQQGNIMTIVDMLQLEDEIPVDFIEHMLELRISLTPAYLKDAAEHNG